jgi:hypothetical protein
MRVIPIRAKKLPALLVDPKKMQGPLEAATWQPPTIGELEMQGLVERGARQLLFATPGPNLAALNIWTPLTGISTS